MYTILKPSHEMHSCIKLFATFSKQSHFLEGIYLPFAPFLIEQYHIRANSRTILINFPVNARRTLQDGICNYRMRHHGRCWIKATKWPGVGLTRLLSPVLTAPVSAVPALFATVRARPGPIR